jgi:hypothetical protein
MPEDSSTQDLGREAEELVTRLYLDNGAFELSC